MGIPVRSGLAGLALLVLGACGGGGGGGAGTPGPPGNPGGGDDGDFTAGVFAPRADFARQCITPRPGTSDRTVTPYT